MKDINAITHYGKTPLIIAIRLVRVNEVINLLSQNASVFVPGKNRETPLQHAVEQITAVMEDHPEEKQTIANLWKIVEILFEHEVNLRKTGAIASDQPKQWEIKKDNRGMPEGDETPIEYLTRMENAYKGLADRGKDVKDNRRLQSIHHEVKSILTTKIEAAEQQIKLNELGITEPKSDDAVYAAQPKRTSWSVLENLAAAFTWFTPSASQERERVERTPLISKPAQHAKVA